MFVCPNFALENEYPYYALPIPVGLNYWGLWTTLLYMKFPSIPKCKYHPSKHCTPANTTDPMTNYYKHHYPDYYIWWKQITEMLSNPRSPSWLKKIYIYIYSKTSNPRALTPQPTSTTFHCSPYRSTFIGREPMNI